MNNRTGLLPYLSGAFLLLVGFSSPVSATHLEECGGVYLEVEAAASCEYVITEECTERCVPVATEKVCASRLTTTCEGECTASADALCVTTCDETCVPVCTTETADANPPNCMGLCMSDCQQDCTASCADSADPGKCRSSCAQVCSTNCHDQCDSDPEPACEPVCDVACDGSCEGRAELDCQLSCQSALYTECEETVIEECKDECETGGAIFCDGQFLASGSNPAPCAEALLAEFDAQVDITAGGEVDGNVDEDSGEVEGLGFLSCAGGGQPQQAAFALFALVALAAFRRRRQVIRTR